MCNGQHKKGEVRVERSAQVTGQRAGSRKFGRQTPLQEDEVSRRHLPKQSPDQSLRRPYPPRTYPILSIGLRTGSLSSNSTPARRDILQDSLRRRHHLFVPCCRRSLLVVDLADSTCLAEEEDHRIVEEDHRRDLVVGARRSSLAALEEAIDSIVLEEESQLDCTVQRRK